MASSTTSTSVSSSGLNRISGLGSSLDIDGIVQKSIAAEKLKKLKRLEQKEQLAEWKQEAYRSIITSVKAFSDKYFELTSANSLLNANNFNKLKVSNSSSAVEVEYSSEASAKNHTIEVTKLATVASRDTGANFVTTIHGSNRVTTASSSLAGKSFTLELDGVQRTVTFDANASADVKTAVQDAIDKAAGTGKLTVNVDANTGILSIAAASSSVQQITVKAPSSGTSALTDLGFDSSSVYSSRIRTSDTLATIASKLDSSKTFSFNQDGQVKLDINGTTFTFDKSMTLSEIVKKINSTDCGAIMKYDETSGKLTLSADVTGAGSTLQTSESGSTFLSLFGAVQAGEDAQVKLDGVALTRSSNTFEVDGITYTLKSKTSEVTIGISQDVDGVYNLISSFVKDYNALMTTLYAATDANYNSKYPPLTKDQKKEMTETEIKNWEAKAKTGLLENDSLIEDLTRNLRVALFEKVPGVSTTAFKIGLEMSKWTENKGRTLEIANEATLKKAIRDNPEEIMKLFTQQSTTHPGTITVRNLSDKEQKIRYNEEGLAYRFYDILQANISTIVGGGTDDSNHKGLLLKKAGMANDSSNTNNFLTTEIKKYNTLITEEEDRIKDKETKLYEQYSKLDSYIAQMNAQLSSMQSLLGG